MTRALIVVDVQPTFCEGGELPVVGGNAVAERVAAYVPAHRKEYALVVTTQDWHIDPGTHFSDQPDFVWWGIVALFVVLHTQKALTYVQILACLGHKNLNLGHKSH